MSEATGTEFFARSHGMLSPTLRTRHVLLAGAGSVGSYAAEQLTRAGVGRLTVVDHDSVEAVNLGRTSYRSMHVGKPKVEALGTLVHEINPHATYEAVSAKTQDVPDARMAELVTSADLVFCALDDPQAQRDLCHHAYALGRPSVFVGLYRRASGGEVSLSVAGEAPCYVCQTGARTRLESDEVAREVDYGVGRLRSEAGLAVDIQHVTSCGVKLGLGLLLRGEPDASVAQLAEAALARRFHLLTLSMVPNYWFFPHVFGDTAGQLAFQAVWLTAESSPQCPICGNAEVREAPRAMRKDVSLDCLRRAAGSMAPE